MKVATQAGGKEYPVTREPQREPTHPGELLADVLESANVSVMAAAEAMDVTRQTVHRVLARQMSVTPEMAVRLGIFAGNGPALWLRMQTAYDLWHAERSHPRLNVVPIGEVRRRPGREMARAVAARVSVRRATRRSAKARA